MMVTEKPNVKKPRLPRARRRTEATRQKLLLAARAVFAEKGLDMARIDDITERADVGKGTFYNYFTGREDLISQMIKEVLNELRREMQDRCRDLTDINELLNAIIGVHIDFFRKRWEDYVLYFQGRADLHLQVSYSGIETPFIDYLETIEELVDSAIKYRLSKPVLRRLACAVAGFVSGYYSFAVISSEDEDVDKVLSSLRSALVAGLVRFIREALPEGLSGRGAR